MSVTSAGPLLEPAFDGRYLGQCQRIGRRVLREQRMHVSRSAARVGRIVVENVAHRGVCYGKRFRRGVELVELLPQRSRHRAVNPVVIVHRQAAVVQRPLVNERNVHDAGIDTSLITLRHGEPQRNDIVPDCRGGRIERDGLVIEALGAFALHESHRLAQHLQDLQPVGGRQRRGFEQFHLREQQAVRLPGVGQRQLREPVLAVLERVYPEGGVHAVPVMPAIRPS